MTSHLAVVTDSEGQKFLTPIASQEEDETPELAQWALYYDPWEGEEYSVSLTDADKESIAHIAGDRGQSMPGTILDMLQIGISETLRKQEWARLKPRND